MLSSIGVEGRFEGEDQDEASFGGLVRTSSSPPSSSSKVAPLEGDFVGGTGDEGR